MTIGRAIGAGIVALAAAFPVTAQAQDDGTGDGPLPPVIELELLDAH